MSVKLHTSARKHQVNQGLTDGGIILAAVFPLWVEPLDDENPQRELRLGFDDAGRLLETGALGSLRRLDRSAGSANRTQKDRIKQGINL